MIIVRRAKGSWMLINSPRMPKCSVFLTISLAAARILLIFDEKDHRRVWMAGNPISLDILYVNEEIEIVRIHRNTPPYSHESIESELPAKYVIEVNAGYTLRHDITEGRRIMIERQ